MRVPGRGKRRWLIVLIILAIAGGAGGTIAFAAPSLITDLVGPKPAPVLPGPRPVLGPLANDAPLPSSKGLSAALDEAAKKVPGRFTGTVIDPASGKALWERTPDKPQMPGSTGKLLTAAAALLALNPTDSFVTRAVAAPDPGTVVLVGGGDPTLTALPENTKGVYPSPSRLTDLAKKVKDAMPGGVKRVVVDLSRYKGPKLADGWNASDVATGYVTPIEPLMVDGGRIDPTQQDTPRVDNPGITAGKAFAKLVGADPDTVQVGTADPNAKKLGAVASAPFSALVEHTLRSSDNVLAEALAREVAIARNGEPSFRGAVDNVLAALKQAGFDVTGAVMSDGSGLSTDDRVPAKLLGALVAAAAAPAQGEHDPEFLRPIITGLPVAGGDGTLGEHGRFDKGTEAASGRGIVRAKTGTLTGVTSLAGVVTDSDGRLLVFALMSNGASPADVRPRLDALAAELGRCGCQ